MGPDKMAKFGSARTRMLTDKDKKVTFDDVAGADEENLKNGDEIRRTQSAVVLETLISQFLYNTAEKTGKE